MNENAKLEGYVLRNHDGKLLTHQKVWMREENTGGWIWSEAEVKQILAEASAWEIKPTHKQSAYLSKATGQTVITGAFEKVKS